MKLLNEFIIFIYYLSIILLTIILLSFIFGIVMSRVLTESNHKTKFYYLELISVWIILITLSVYIKYNFRIYSKKTITIYVEKNDNDYNNFNDLVEQIDEFAKFDIIIIVGFIIVFLNSYQHSQNEKIKLLNEDLGFFIDLFV